MEEKKTPPEKLDGVYSVRGADNLCKLVFNMTAAAAALTFVMGAFGNNGNIEADTQKQSAKQSNMMQGKFLAASGAFSLGSLLSFGIWSRHRRYFPELNQRNKNGGDRDQDDEPPTTTSSMDM